MAEAAAVAVAAGDAGSTQRAAVVAAFEGEHQAFAVAGVAHHLERIFDGLRTADIEVHAASPPPLGLGVLRDHFRQLDLGWVQILAGHLRQRVQLALHDLGQALVLVAEVDRRVPHLQVEELGALGVVHERAFAAGEELRVGQVVHRIAVGAVGLLQAAQFEFFGERIGRDVVHGNSGL